MSVLEDQLSQELSAYLADLEVIQARLLETLQKESESLTSSDAARISQFAEHKQKLLSQLQEFLKRRLKLLTEARSQGIAVPSLQALAKRLDPTNHERLFKIQQAEQRAQMIHRLSVGQWVACQKASLHYQQVATLIATQGQYTNLDQTNQHLAENRSVLDLKV